MRKMAMIGAVTSVVAAIGLLGAAPAQAQADGFTITTGGLLLRGEIGSSQVVAQQSSGEFEGSTCSVSAIDNNNQSIHQNDLLVSSGGQTVTVVDIEGAVGSSGIKDADGPLTLGPTVTVSVLFQNTDASDNAAIDPETGTTFPPNTGTFSAQIEVFFECQPAVTTTAPPTTPPPPPVLQFDFLGPVCEGNFPFINYAVSGDVDPTDTATIVISDVNGTVVQTLTGQPLSGRVIWPGASVNPPDWPGWVLEGGVWVEDPTDDVLREDLTITVSVNPEASDTVAYPPATSACADPPDGTPTTPAPTTAPPPTSPNPSPTLPVTGGGDATTNGLLLGLLLLSAGGSIFLAVRRRPG
jgi:LPXTG-motif cell wall-anchored protein